MFRSLSGLRTRLVLLVLLAVVPALGLVLYTSLESSRHNRAADQNQVLAFARTSSAQQDDLVEGGRQLLTAIAQLPEVRSADPATCGAFLAGLLSQYSSYTSFATLNPAGDVVCSSAPLSRPTNMADRAYFPRVLSSHAFTVGEYTLGRLTGKPVLTLAYPILRATPDGTEVQAIVVAGLDLAWLNQTVARTRLPAGGSLLVIDRGGTVLAQQPDSDLWVGRSAPAAVIAAINARGEGTVAAAGVDGVTRLYGFTGFGPLDSGVHVAVGEPEIAVFSTSNATLKLNVALFLGAGLLALVAAWLGGHLFVVRRTRALLSAARRIAAGDLSARAGAGAGNGELDQLARAFDSMAAALQERVQQAERRSEPYASVKSASVRSYSTRWT